MLTIQRKRGVLMVEICHSVEAVMANQTVPAEFPGVLKDKIRVIVGVAGLTFCVRCRKITLNLMAGCTLDGVSIVVNLVPGQAENCLRVIEL